MQPEENAGQPIKRNVSSEFWSDAPSGQPDYYDQDFSAAELEGTPMEADHQQMQKEWIKYLADMTGTGYWFWELQTNRFYLTRRTRELFGFPPDFRVTYTLFLERLFPGDRERVDKAVRQSLKDRTEYFAEYRVVWPDASTHWIAARGRGLDYDEQGRPARMAGVVADNSQRMYMAQQLREKTEALESMLESISDIFANIDREERFVYLNQRALDLLETTKEVALGKRMGDLFPFYKGTELEHIIRETLETGKPHFAPELEFGQFNQWFDIRVYPSQDGASVYGRIVTEQVQAQQALRASEAKFRRLAEANIIGVVVADSQGNLLEANHAFLILLGYTPAEFEPGCMNWKDITVPSFHHLDEQAKRELIQNGVSDSYEKELIAKDGQFVWVVMAGAQLDAGDGIYFVLDVTAQKELEKQREVFVNMAGHELRNPLAGIKGNLQLILRRLQRLVAHNEVAAPADKIAALFEAMEGALRQVDLEARLIEDLLDVTRTTTDQLNISASEQYLDAVVQKATEDLRVQAAPREIHLSQFPQSPVLAIIDSDRIKQVLMNFITNALKYSPDATPIDVRIIVEQDIVRVEVRDEGPGLTLEEQEEIWKPYYQTGRAKKRQGKSGLGLGLHINQRIVSAHNGQIGVESQPGHGATFWFTLPLVKRQPPKIL